MYSSILIANKVISILRQKGVKGSDYKPTIMELVKLCYIAHGWFLGAKGKSLINDEELIEAWPYGPVLVNLYKDFRSQGVEISDLSKSVKDKELEEEDQKYLEEIIKHYSEFNAFILSDLTHDGGTPWTETVSKSGLYANIPTKLIKQYYKKLNEELNPKS